MYNGTLKVLLLFGLKKIKIHRFKKNIFKGGHYYINFFYFKTNQTSKHMIGLRAWKTWGMNKQVFLLFIFICMAKSNCHNTISYISL